MAWYCVKCNKRFEDSFAYAGQPPPKCPKCGTSHKVTSLHSSAAITAADITSEACLSQMVFCRGCGKQIHETARACPGCGAIQRTSNPKSKVVAGFLAFFLGGLGIHRFYLGQWWGLFYLLFALTYIPSVISFIEAIVFWCTSDDSWNDKYG